ncbi:MAG: PQQ-binding-like beta-propeller repeat protein [Phycisphaerae bacterium]
MSSPISRSGFVCVLILMLACAATALAEAPAGPGWPNSVSYDFAPPPTGTDLTDDPQIVRLAWFTPMHTGFGKGGLGSVMDAIEAGFEPTIGNTAGPVVSDEVLLVSWAQSSGEVTARPESFTDRYFKEDARLEDPRVRDTYMRIDADWVTVALDARTGEELWRQVEPSAAMNFQSSKRGHNGINGAAGDGVYVTVSLLGHVFAYDIAGGEQLWHATLPDWHEAAQAFKDEAIAERRMPGITDGMFGYKRSGAIVVGDIAVVPDLRGGVVGFDLAGGQRRWEASNVLHDQATPRKWTDDAGKTWLIFNDASRHGSGKVHMLDPRTGEKAWSHDTGLNPGQLHMGEGHILLNTETNSREPARWTCYRITPDGLEEKWSMPEGDGYRFSVRPDRGAERRAVIRDGVVYAALGVGDKPRLVRSFALDDGRELDSTDHSFRSNAGLPVVLEDMLYWQRDSSHSGSGAGLIMFHLDGKGELAGAGEVMYQGLDVKMISDYEYPIEWPYANGMLYLRGHDGIAAIDLRPPQHSWAKVELHDVWAGFHRPLEAYLFADADGTIATGRMETPPRRELGIVATTARRKDIWSLLTFDGEVALGEAVDTTETFDFGPFSWEANITMETAEDGMWRGTWTRRFEGWDETVELSGKLDEHSEGGYTRRGWPTGWLEHQPVTFFSDLPDGAERVFLQMYDALPREEGPRNLTLSLDHDGERVIGGVGGGFSFNQAYHEIDARGLEVDEDGISGTARIILNSDQWVPGDMRNGGSLLGELTLDLRFGEPDDEGIHPVRGDWSITWGIAGERSGEIRCTIERPKDN